MECNVIMVRLVRLAKSNALRGAVVTVNLVYHAFVPSMPGIHRLWVGVHSNYPKIRI